MEIISLNNKFVSFDRFQECSLHVAKNISVWFVIVSFRFV